MLDACAREVSGNRLTLLELCLVGRHDVSQRATNRSGRRASSDELRILAGVLFSLPSKEDREIYH